jgi:hypothetical protein
MLHLAVTTGGVAVILAVSTAVPQARSIVKGALDWLKGFFAKHSSASPWRFRFALRRKGRKGGYFDVQISVERDGVPVIHPPIPECTSVKTVKKLPLAIGCADSSIPELPNKPDAPTVQLPVTEIVSILPAASNVRPHASKRTTTRKRVSKPGIAPRRKVGE